MLEIIGALIGLILMILPLVIEQVQTRQQVRDDSETDRVLASGDKRALSARLSQLFDKSKYRRGAR